MQRTVCLSLLLLSATWLLAFWAWSLPFALAGDLLGAADYIVSAGVLLAEDAAPPAQARMASPVAAGRGAKKSA